MTAPPLMTPPLSFDSPALLTAAVAVTLATVAVAVARRAAVRRGSAGLLLFGVSCLCLGAGGLTWQYERTGNVAVVVDASPSTRGAGWRERQALESRIEALLGGASYTLHALFDGVTPRMSLADLPDEIATSRTTYAPPAGADAVLLFSDLRLTPPEAVDMTPSPPPPPTYVVIDPALERVDDAAVQRVELRGTELLAAVTNTGSAPRLFGTGGADSSGWRIEPGRFVIASRAEADADQLVAAFAPGDRWPENDLLRLRVPPPQTRERWWVSAPGAAAAPRGWMDIKPGALPTNPMDYLAPAVIVLHNLAADAVAPTQLDSLEQYVRDLGGGLVILGGDRTFAAGAYAGSALERLSPLASTPPRAVVQWMILIDSSGSMAAKLGDNTRWHFAAQAAARIIPSLPPDDLLTIGNFAGALRWWSAGGTVRAAQASLTWPKELLPGGATNLDAALKFIAASADDATPTQMLLITDADATIADAAALGASLAERRVQVHVLASGNLAPAHPLRAIAQRTGGRIAPQPDPRQWATELRRLMRAASPDSLVRRPLQVRFTGAAPRLPPLTAEVWNRTWLKTEATELAVGDVTADGTGAAERVPAVAAWNTGSGAVIACGFAPPAELAVALAERVATPPRDPRFRVAWEPASPLRVTLEAGSSDGGYLNGLAPRLELSSDGKRANDAFTLRQTGPGRYEAVVPAPRRAAFAAVLINGRLIDRFSVAGRYAAEFESLGNDRAAMEAMAKSTGGAVIEPSHITPIDFKWPKGELALAPYLAAAGAVLVGAGLIRWRDA